MVFAPKRAKGLSQAQGFNPGNHPNQWFGLKGREMRTRLTCVVATFDLAPLQGAPPWDGVPGVETPYVFSVLS
jgi:hypothetical protein